MSCVYSRYYKDENLLDVKNLKAYAIDDKFLFELESYNGRTGWSQRDYTRLTVQDAKDLKKQLEEFIHNNEEQ